MGGSVRAIEEGYQQREISDAAYKFQQEIEGKQRISVGVNKYESDQVSMEGVLRIDPALEKQQLEQLGKVKSERDGAQVQKTLDRLGEVARGEDNTLPAILECVEAYASIGEICDVLRDVTGEYQPSVLY